MRVSKKTVFTYLALAVINTLVFLLISSRGGNEEYVFSNIVYGVIYGIASYRLSKKILLPNIILIVSFGIIGPIFASEFAWFFEYSILLKLLVGLWATGIVLVASLLSSAAVSLIIRLTRFIKQKKEPKEQ